MADPAKHLGDYRDANADKYPSNWHQIEQQTKLERGKRCEFCGQPEQHEEILQVHHVQPVHTADGEANAANPDNLIVLCPRDHLREGHVGNFMDWDPSIKTRAAANRAAINQARELTGVTPELQAPV